MAIDRRPLAPVSTRLVEAIPDVRAVDLAVAANWLVVARQRVARHIGPGPLGHKGSRMLSFNSASIAFAFFQSCD